MTNNTSQDKRLQILCCGKVNCGGRLSRLINAKTGQRSRCAAGTIYRYFDDKDHLIEDVRIQVTQRVADAVQMVLMIRFNKATL
ncbi:TetR/AcrR family transcriptional regulator [Vibrio lentus]|nr:TetR/AcrR family transcriptional regulator [Vibrio lentus]